MLQRRTTGFSLLEIMITTFLIGIGLLGLGLAQISAVNANQEAGLRLQATNLASSLTQRFRLNESYFSDKSMTSNIYTLEKGNVYSQYCKNNLGNVTVNLPALPTSCIDNMCTPEEIARFDIHDICQGEFKNSNFPNGELGVMCHDIDTTDSDDCTPGSLISIFIGWQSKMSRRDLGEKTMSADVSCASTIWGSSSAAQGKQCIKVDVAI